MLALELYLKKSKVLILSLEFVGIVLPQALFYLFFSLPNCSFPFPPSVALKNGLLMHF